MALPIINDTPKYTLTIPSTKKAITYRPFLVKEQKILLMALESQDQKQVLQAITDTIVSCVMEPIDINRLATFDVEYIFTQIRSKSVGETSTVNVRCEKCEDFNEVTIPLDDIFIDIPKDKNEIVITDQYTVIMRYPSYGKALENYDSNEKSITGSLYNSVLLCLDKLKTKDELLPFDDETPEEIQKFLESLNNEQFEKLLVFVNELTILSHDVSFECKCGHTTHHTLEGLADFF